VGYYVEVERGVKLYVEDVGAGRPVLFIHGWPVDHRMFEYQTTHLPGYGFRCIQPDLRGFGRSDQTWTGYTYDRLSDDIRVIIDTLRLSSVKLVGFSMGGAIAIRYMRRHAGHNVSQLLLLAAAAPAFTQRPGYPYGMTKEEVNKLIEAGYKDRPKMLESFGEIFFASKVSPAFRSWFHSLGLKASNRGTAATAVSLRDEDCSPDLPYIRVPTAIFHGVSDKVCPFAFARLLNKGIKGSVLHRFERSGHAIFYDELDLFNRRFFSELSAYP
jgi:pimeloyl-ACP methyl ester carboxylesterase